MNKTELIAAVAEKAGLTKKDVEKTITATLETVKEVVAKGDKVQVVGFGTFEARARKEREGKNPQNGEKVVLPAATIPAFKAGKAFKDAVVLVLWPRQLLPGFSKNILRNTQCWGAMIWLDVV